MRIIFIDSNILAGRNIGAAYIVTAAAKKSENKVKVMRPFSYAGVNRYGKLKKRSVSNQAESILSDNLISEIETFKPEVFAFSITSFTFEGSLSIAAFLRPRYPGISFIWGGVHPTLLPEETIRNPLVDAICIGEGEKSFPEYLAKLEKNENPDVDGIWYKDKSGQIVRNRLRPFEEDLDALPFPDWDRWDADDILRRNSYYMPGSLSILPSRGCPYDCSFCSNAAIRQSVPGRYYRLRSSDNVISEIKYNKKKYKPQGFRNINFADETFGLDIKWLRGFCGKFINENLHKEFSWQCATRADVVTAEWAKAVAEAGCKWVWLGVESGNDYIRRVVYKKDIKEEDIVRATLNLRKNGINVGFYLMVGCPGESIKSIFSSVKLIHNANPAVSYISFYIPLPRTELSSSVNEKIRIGDQEIKDYWNVHRGAAIHLGFNKTSAMLWFVRIFKVLELFMRGIKLRGPGFFRDLFKYFFFDQREVSLFSRSLFSDLEQKTVFKYFYFERQRR